jgi:hypothetical protein
MGYSTILVTAIFWIAIALIAVAASFFSYLSRTARYRMLQSLAEKGQPLPPELLANLAELDTRGGPRQSLRGGIVLVCIGVALAFFFWAMTGGGGFDGPIRGVSWLPAVGVFPFMVGVALLLIAVFDRHPPRPKN